MDELTDPDPVLVAPVGRPGEGTGRTTAAISAWNLVSRATGFARLLVTAAAIWMTDLPFLVGAENFADALVENTNMNFGSDDVVRWQAMTDTAVRIEKSRGALRNNIRKAQATADIKSYDISQAIYDAERYHQLCSFSNVYMVGEQVETVASGTVIVPEASTDKTKDKQTTTTN